METHWCLCPVVKGSAVMIHPFISGELEEVVEPHMPLESCLCSSVLWPSWWWCWCRAATDESWTLRWKFFILYFPLVISILWHILWREISEEYLGWPDVPVFSLSPASHNANGTLHLLSEMKHLFQITWTHVPSYPSIQAKLCLLTSSSFKMILQLQLCVVHPHILL